MDVREGGKWNLVMIAGPRRIHWDGEYIEVNEPERLSFTVSDQPDQDLYDLAPSSSPTAADRTEMLFQQSGGLYARRGLQAGEEGWAACSEYLSRSSTPDNQQEEMNEREDRRTDT